MIPSKVGADVSHMFASISGRYDLANSVLSFGVHHIWRRTLLRAVSGRHYKAALDLCTGTADLVPLLLPLAEHVTGADFCEGMLVEGREKLKGLSPLRCSLELADAMSLPYADNRFDLLTVAFGVRNFENLERGLNEIFRCMTPGGRLAVLEFGQPKGLFGQLYRQYSAHVLPVLGGILTGNRTAYGYLERTSQTFPCADRFTQKLLLAGFTETSFKSLTGGICYLYLAKKP